MAMAIASNFLNSMEMLPDLLKVIKPHILRANSKECEVNPWPFIRSSMAIFVKHCTRREK